MPEVPGISKGRRIAGAILIVLPALALTASSLAKFAHVPSVTAQMAEVGFSGSRLLLIAVLEILSALLLFVPRMRSVGWPMASAYLGGAIATHLGHGQSPAPPAVLLALLWIGISLRYPAAFWSMRVSQ